MERLDVSLFSTLVACTQELHKDDDAMVSFEARIRPEILDWCREKLTHPVTVDCFYRSAATASFDHLRRFCGGGYPFCDFPLPRDAAARGIFGTGSLRLMFGSKGDRYLFVQSWGNGQDPIA